MSSTCCVSQCGLRASCTYKSVLPLVAARMFNRCKFVRGSSNGSPFSVPLRLRGRSLFSPQRSRTSMWIARIERTQVKYPLQVWPNLRRANPRQSKSRPTILEQYDGNAAANWSICLPMQQCNQGWAESRNGGRRAVDVLNAKSLESRKQMSKT